jgi:hypothetical protein
MTASIAKALAVLCVSALGACDACSSRDERVARLAQTDGKVQRDFAARTGRWQSAAAGNDFEVGDGLRTGGGARAELDLLPSGRLRVEAETVVRFARTPPGQKPEPRVELEAGAIELEAAVAELEITSAHGRARITPGSRMHVRSAQSGLTFAVDVGRVLLEQDGRTRELRGGDSFVLDVGTLSVEPSPQPPPAPVAVDAGAAPAAVAVTAKPTSTRRRRARTSSCRRASPRSSTTRARPRTCASLTPGAPARLPWKSRAAAART